MWLSLPGIVLELKANGTPEGAVGQIKEREYGEKLKREGVECIILTGINYDTSSKEHQCRIEYMDGFGKSVP